MKTKQLYGVLGSFILFCLLTGGCTKTSIDKNFIQVQSSLSISEAKSWLTDHLSANAAGKSISRASIINPDWEHVVSKDDEVYQSLEIPVSFTSKFFLSKSADKAVDNSKNLVKYLILKNKKTGEISSVLMNAVSDKKINGDGFHYAQASTDFSGNIFYLNAETAALITGWEYKDGKITGTITAGKHIEALEPVCTDSEWGVFSTTCYYTPSGGLRYCDDPELLYTYIITTCSGGGGGGVSNPPPPPPNNCAEAEAQAQAFLNQGVATSSGATTVIESATNTEVKVSYKWQIYSAVTWFLDSEEKGIINKFYYPNNTSRWEYTSFYHNKIYERGVSFGGIRTFTDENHDIQITPTRQTAWVRVAYTVTSKPAGIPGCQILLPNGHQDLASEIHFYAE